MKLDEEKKKKIIIELKQILVNHGFTLSNYSEFIPEFLFSVGSELEQVYDLQTSEDVLTRYGENPTFGNALMAQAIWMRDAWKLTTEKGNTNERQLHRKL